MAVTTLMSSQEDLETTFVLTEDLEIGSLHKFKVWCTLKEETKHATDCDVDGVKYGLVRDEQCRRILQACFTKDIGRGKGDEAYATPLDNR